jgi:hypothetical protein
MYHHTVICFDMESYQIIELEFNSTILGLDVMYHIEVQLFHN